MNMKTTKILPKLLLFLRTNVFKVLVSENNYAPLCNQKGQFILLSVVQLR